MDRLVRKFSVKLYPITERSGVAGPLGQNSVSGPPHQEGRHIVTLAQFACRFKPVPLASQTGRRFFFKEH